MEKASFLFLNIFDLKYASLTMGHRQILASVIVNVAMVTGLKSRILGYMSIGDKVWGVKRKEKQFRKNSTVLFIR